MYLFGFSINVLTLLAIVLATGLVVDDGIVVTENIFKKLEEGYHPIEAAIRGSNEIFFAIISTSISLAAVFLPVIFMEGFVGRLFREFGIVLASAVLISAFVSLTLTPVLNAYLIRKKEKPNRLYDWSEPFFKRMEKSYNEGLSKFLGKKWLAFPLFAIVAFMNADMTNMQPYFEGSGTALDAGIVTFIVMSMICWYLFGFSIISQTAEEASPTMGPQDIGKAIVLSLILATIFYVVVHLFIPLVLP